MDSEKNQRTLHLGGDAEDNVIIAGDGNIINIIEQKSPTPSESPSEDKKLSVRHKKIAMIAGILLISAILIVVGIYFYLKIPKTLNISGVWKYHVPKDERTWIIRQNGNDITIKEDSGNDCTGRLDKKHFSFSCTEQMTGGAESEKLTGSGQLNQDGTKIQGKWERQGLEGGFVLERDNR